MAAIQAIPAFFINNNHFDNPAIILYPLRKRIALTGNKKDYFVPLKDSKIQMILSHIYLV
jgi:hypothetical protein